MKIRDCLLYCLMMLVTLAPGAAPAEAQTRAYVTNPTANVVNVIDTATNAVVGTIAVGAGPSRVAISQDGSRAYVTNTASNSVSVIDTATDTVLRDIAVGDTPSTIAVTPGGDRVYVMVAGGVVQVIDTTANAIVASVVTHGIGDMAVTPDGSRVYVASGHVDVIDTATNTLVASFAAEHTAVANVINVAVAVAFSPDGTRAYIPVVIYDFRNSGFSADGGVAVVDTASNSVTGMIRLGSQPGSIALTRDGGRAYVGIQSLWVNTIYVAGFFPGRYVAAIDTSTNAAIAWIDLGADGNVWDLQNTPAELAVTPDRSAVYVAIPRIGSVAALDTASNVVTMKIPVGTFPYGLAIVPDPSAALKPYLIDAVDDSTPAPVPACCDGAVVGNVLANDLLGGARASAGSVALSLVSSTSPGVLLDDASGIVTVAQATEVGIHSLVYKICEKAVPDNCDVATMTVPVRAPYVIDAANDGATAFPGTRAVASVLDNDTLGGAAARSNSVTLSVTSSSDADITLNPVGGSVSVAEGAAVGVHTLVYRICEIESPGNCDEATVTVTVVPLVITAAPDTGASPRTGGTAVANVLANDTLGGVPATLARVTLSLVSSTNAGVTLGLANGSVSVAPGTTAGNQTLVYRICETGRPSNCTDGTATVTVNPYVVQAVNDSARASSRQAGTVVASVLGNDTIGGAPATPTNVTLSLVSLTPANSKIWLDLSNGSVNLRGKTSSGTYLLVYRICETENATNCSQATVTLVLSGR